MADARTRQSGSARPRRNTRPRDALGRPLPYGTVGVGEQPEGISRTAQESLIEAHRLLGDGHPFHAHEVLEDAWKAQPDVERELWRGLAQIAVGITHAARGNAVGGVRLIERGAANLAPYVATRPYGLDLAAVIEWSDHAVAQIGRGTPVRLEPPPLLPNAVDDART
ncbi:DUF309 domain-containing protein [Jatrophihabitans sp.]|uniref:DUF309 domain-containing protein n=1 Tax=Jatrophihabitans sp. TaxID=1932789 RepID=UPI0030C65C4C